MLRLGRDETAMHAEAMTAITRGIPDSLTCDVTWICRNDQTLPMPPVALSQPPNELLFTDSITKG